MMLVIRTPRQRSWRPLLAMTTDIVQVLDPEHPEALLKRRFDVKRRPHGCPPR
jgi:hypothetical protein